MGREADFRKYNQNRVLDKLYLDPPLSDSDRGRSEVQLLSIGFLRAVANISAPKLFFELDNAWPVVFQMQVIIHNHLSFMICTHLAQVSMDKTQGDCPTPLLKFYDKLPRG